MKKFWGMLIFALVGFAAFAFCPDGECPVHGRVRADHICLAVEYLDTFIKETPNGTYKLYGNIDNPREYMYFNLYCNDDYVMTVRPEFQFDGRLRWFEDLANGFTDFRDFMYKVSQWEYSFDISWICEIECAKELGNDPIPKGMSEYYNRRECDWW